MPNLERPNGNGQGKYFIFVCLTHPFFTPEMWSNKDFLISYFFLGKHTECTSPPDHLIILKGFTFRPCQSVRIEWEPHNRKIPLNSTLISFEKLSPEKAFIYGFGLGSTSVPSFCLASCQKFPIQLGISPISPPLV